MQCAGLSCSIIPVICGPYHSAQCEGETVQWATVPVLPLLLKSEEFRFNQMVVSDKMLSTIRSGPPLQVGGLWLRDPELWSIA